MSALKKSRVYPVPELEGVFVRALPLGKRRRIQAEHADDAERMGLELVMACTVDESGQPLIASEEELEQIPDDNLMLILETYAAKVGKRTDNAEKNLQATGLPSS